MSSSARREALVTTALTLALGVLLALSPLLVHYRHELTSAHAVAGGLTLAMLSLLRLSLGPRAHGLAVLTLLVGLWLTVSSLVLDGAFMALWALTLAGAMAVVLTACSVLAAAEEAHGP